MNSDIGRIDLPPPECRKCHAAMKAGIAIESTWVGSQDMGDVCTMNTGGPGRIVDCLKCPECGYSITQGVER